MNADQVIDGIGKAVAANIPLDNYCFLSINLDPLCTNIPMWQLLISAFGTIGTIAAVIVALWVSITANRQRFKTEVGIRQINIVNVLPFLEGLVSEIESTTTYAVFGNRTSSDFVEARQTIERLKIWAKNYGDRKELTALTPESILLLPERSGLQISHAMGIFRAVQIEILRYVPETHPAIDFCSRSTIYVWADEMRKANNFIKAAIRNLKNEIDFKSLHPSIDEYYEVEPVDQDEEFSKDGQHL